MYRMIFIYCKIILYYGTLTGFTGIFVLITLIMMDIAEIFIR